METLTNRILKLSIPNWECEKDSHSGCIFWLNKNDKHIIYGTPNFDGFDGILFEIIDNDTDEIKLKETVPYLGTETDDMILSLYESTLLLIISKL